MNNHSFIARFFRGWKRFHMNQVLVLSFSTAVLAFLGFFHVYSEGADVSALNDNLNLSTIIYDHKGEVASKISSNKNEGVKINEIPDDMKNAVIAIEDHRFYEHDGIDYLGISRAFYKNIKAGGIVEGGSTITQQLTKNTLLTSEKTYKRKIEEFFLAREIEKQYSKDEIMQMYLNRIYFGNGSWGVKRAAMNYFGKELKDISADEAALLAGLIKAPSALDPYNHYDAAIERRNVVLQAMKTQGFLSEEEYQKAVEKKVVLNEGGRDPLRGKHPFYIDHVIEEAISRYGLTQDELLSGGYRIYTEMDVSMQTAMEDTYSKDELFPKGTKDQNVQSGGVLVDPKTGGVRAIVGGRGEHVFRGFNRATQLKTQPGSIMKPLVVYTPALEEGWGVTEKLKDEEMEFNGYKPGNHSGTFKGDVPMHEALKDSLNVPAVWLLNEMGISKGLDAAKRFGIPLDENDRNLAIALGGLDKGVSPLNMAEAYSAFANDGVRTEAHAISRIEDSEGNKIVEWKEKKTKVTEKEIADKMTSMLLEVVQEGTGRGAQISGREVAGKTGTTQVPVEGIKGVKDQWFVGYTPQLVGAVWVGYDQTDEKHYLTTTSSEGAALVFKDFMGEALKGTKPASFNVKAISEYEREQKNKTKKASATKKDPVKNSIERKEKVTEEPVKKKPQTKKAEASENSQTQPQSQPVKEQPASSTSSPKPVQEKKEEKQKTEKNVSEEKKQEHKPEQAPAPKEKTNSGKPPVKEVEKEKEKEKEKEEQGNENNQSQKPEEKSSEPAPEEGSQQGGDEKEEGGATEESGGENTEEPQPPAEDTGEAEQAS
ncbi:transglycosylase domain-containing protein [Mesobacillus foraminis]|nr:PBP1A family penicillin-binding protein [Mesobacillus foraminis]